MNQEAFGVDFHPTIIDKAAFLWYSIATKQLFNNGNKRTAFLSTIMFLKFNFLNFPIIIHKNYMICLLHWLQGKSSKLN
ncbi:Fic family protein [Oenococcus sicerae]|uniref:Fic family protein n=1 Tax=Oenococcus sicerae TaxID=2203724 RepID=UPI001FACBA67|nr:Fic family protein [Oenococcus sicerae]